MPIAWPLLRTRLSLRRRFAALGLVGALMVLLPLVQVLRYQVQAIDTARAQLAALDPVLLAVAAQRTVLAHRPLAAQVLAGDEQHEPQRRHVQAEVDERVFRLDMALTVHGQVMAATESEALRQDWTTLARQVQARELTVPASESAHRLLVEQLLQVVDLVTLGAHWRDDEAATQALAQATQRVLPHVAVALAALPAPGGPAAVVDASADAPADNAAAQRLQRLFARLHQASVPGQHTGGSQARAAALALAQQALRGAQAARTWAAAPATDTAARDGALAELHAVHATLQPHAQAALAPRLQARVQGLERERLLTLGLTALLAAAGVGLLLSLWPRKARVDAKAVRTLPADIRPPGAPAMPAPRVETGALLDRLRGVARTPPAEMPSPTLPPRD
jgi:hypothetical protein